MSATCERRKDGPREALAVPTGRRMIRLLTALAIAATGIALGVVAALFLVLWRSGAEPDEPAVTEPAGLFV